MNFANPFARIVVGYDHSSAAAAALEQALTLAEQYGGEVIAAYVSDLSAPAVLQIATAAKHRKDDASPILASLDKYRQELFEQLCDRVASRTVPVSLDFSTNSPAAGIVDAAERWKATAIAVGTHARGRITHALIGSVAEDVLRTAVVPVIVSRGVAPPTRLERIVVGIDASESAENASVFAVALACAQPVRLVYCTVIDTMSITSPMADLPFDPTPLCGNLRAAARDALDAALQYATAVDVYPDTEVADAADVASELIDVAHRQAASAIVVGAHAQGTVQRFFLGSTAESVVRRSDVSVIVVPAVASIAPGASSRIPAAI
jgi:nucleotide-binding universal stress UspA family protein